MKAADYDEVAFLAYIYKAVFGVYRVSSQLPIAAMFAGLQKGSPFRPLKSSVNR